MHVQLNIQVNITLCFQIEGKIRDHTKHDDIVEELKSRHNISVKANTKLAAPTDVQDYLTTGSVLGEIALLTKQKRNATISCETSAQVGTIFF